MKRLRALRVPLAAAGTAAAVIAYLILYVADYRFAAAGAIFAVWAIRYGLAKLGPKGLSAGWRRLRTYVFLQQLAIQFIVRQTAWILLLRTAYPAEIGLLELVVASIIVHVLARHFGPVLFRRAFKASVVSRGFEHIDEHVSTINWFDGSNAKFRRLTGRWRRWLDIFEPLGYLAMLILRDDGADVLKIIVGAHLGVGVFNLAVLFFMTLKTVKIKAYRTKEDALFAAVEAYEPTIVLYFSAGSAKSFYQIRQWLPFLESSGHRMLIVTRERKLLTGLYRMCTRTPVVWVQRLVDLDRMLVPSVKAAAYVNNGMKNGHMLRVGHLTHIQLLHGESDKGSSASKATRAYDIVAVAGQAAIDRYAENGVPIPRSQFAIVGRPPTDEIEFAEQAVGVRNVFYAPTWEGFDPASDWSSVRAIGVPALAWLLEHRPDLRIVMKPHPLTGDVNKELRSELTTMREMLHEANERRGLVDVEGEPPVAHKYYGMRSKMPINELFNEADALICDISSVPADFLRSNKPMFICDVRGVGRDAIWDMFPTTRGSYVIDGTTESWVRASVAFDDDPLYEARAATRLHVLGDFEGSATDQFHQMLDRAIGHTAERVFPTEEDDDEDEAAAAAATDADLDPDNDGDTSNDESADDASEGADDE